MKHLYLALAVAGTLIPYTAILPWFAQYGLDAPRFIQEMFQAGVPRMFSLDLILSALVLFVMAVRTHKKGVPHTWVILPSTVIVGVSLGLPLLLYLEARHDERAT